MSTLIILSASRLKIEVLSTCGCRFFLYWCVWKCCHDDILKYTSQEVQFPTGGPFVARTLDRPTGRGRGGAGAPSRRGAARVQGAAAHGGLVRGLAGQIPGCSTKHRLRTTTETGKRTLTLRCSNVTSYWITWPFPTQ